MSALAPPAEAAAALDVVRCPGQVVYGDRDDTVDSQSVADAAREWGFVVDALPADHHYVGQAGRVGDRIADFLADALTGSGH